MPLSNRRKVYFSIITLLLLCTYAAILYARLSYTTPNRFAPYLEWTPEQIYVRASCYEDSYAYYTYNTLFCSIGTDIGFTLDNRARVTSASFSRTAITGLRIGDLLALFGQPENIHPTPLFVNWMWYVEGYRVLAYSRYNDLYSPVRFVLFSVRS